MALPNNPDMLWPPPTWREVYEDYAEWDAWYSGDPNRLASVYSGKVLTPTKKGFQWAKEVKEERRVMVHVPVASDISRVSADFLFSEAPKIRIPEAHAENAPSDAKRAQDRIEAIIENAGVVNRLLSAADNASALGGVFLKINWDRELADFPLLSIAQADSAVPEFRFGLLQAVTFWRTIEEDGENVWRHLERHEVLDGRAVVLNGLYVGDEVKLGKQVDLIAHPETADLQPEVQTGIPGLDVRYVPNMMPNRKRRATHPYIGSSDYLGLEGLMDALDEVWTSWLRDIRLAKARIITSEDYLKKNADGSFGFDVDQEIFTPLDVSPEDAVGITLSQFDIRTEEHLKACQAYLERIITGAGYSPQSFGLNIEGRAESGTALRIRERASFITTGKKQAYWKAAISDILQAMLYVDKTVFKKTPAVYKPAVEFSDSVVPDLTEMAQAVELVSRAQAASIETRVRWLHPDWTVEQVTAEVMRIMEEQGMSAPDPIQVGVS